MSDCMDDYDDEYQFEYEDGDEMMDDEGDAQLENAYYQAKQTRTDSVADSIDMFESVIAMEDKQGEWGFKALKQMVKLQLKAKQYPSVIKTWKRLTGYAHSSAVTRNYADKSFNKLLDRTEKAVEGPEAFGCVEQVYSTILAAFANDDDRRLGMKTGIRLARLYLEKKDYGRAAATLRDVRRNELDEFWGDETGKALFAMDIIALEIQLATETHNTARMKALYKQAMALKTAVFHAKTVAIIRECGGKMHMDEENWEEAQKEFYESFRNYDEAGAADRVRVLRYLVLAYILNPYSRIDPFDSPELRPFERDPAVAPVVALKAAYGRRSMDEYAAVLATHRAALDADPFFAAVLGRLTDRMREAALAHVTMPYHRFGLAFAADRLRVPVPDVVDILVAQICDGEHAGRIDDYGGTVTAVPEPDGRAVASLAMARKSLARLYQSVRDSLDGGVCADAWGGGGGSDGGNDEAGAGRTPDSAKFSKRSAGDTGIGPRRRPRPSRSSGSQFSPLTNLLRLALRNGAVSVGPMDGGAGGPTRPTFPLSGPERDELGRGGGGGGGAGDEAGTGVSAGWAAPAASGALGEGDGGAEAGREEPRRGAGDGDDGAGGDGDGDGLNSMSLWARRFMIAQSLREGAVDDDDDDDGGDDDDDDDDEEDDDGDEDDDDDE